MSLVMIVPMSNRTKAVHLNGGRVKNGTRIHLWAKAKPGDKNFANQLWVYKDKKFICYKNPIKCLHLVHGKTRNGTKLQLWDRLRDNNPRRSNQEFRLLRKNIVSMKNPDACWHLAYGRTSNGTKIQLWDAKNHKNGSWALVKVKARVRPSFRRICLCMIVPMKSQRKTVRLVGGKTSNGTKIQLGDRIRLGDAGYEKQLFLFDGSTFRSSKDIGKCLRLMKGSTKIGTPIVLGNFEKGNVNQLWDKRKANIVTKKRSSACWSLENGKTANGTKIVIGNELNPANGFKIQFLFRRKKKRRAKL